MDLSGLNSRSSLKPPLSVLFVCSSLGFYLFHLPSFTRLDFSPSLSFPNPPLSTRSTEISFIGSCFCIDLFPGSSSLLFSYSTCFISLSTTFLPGQLSIAGTDVTFPPTESDGTARRSGSSDRRVEMVHTPGD